MALCCSRVCSVNLGIGVGSLGNAGGNLRNVPESLGNLGNISNVGNNGSLVDDVILYNLGKGCCWSNRTNKLKLTARRRRL